MKEKILLVDDDPTIVSACKDYLEFVMPGFEVVGVQKFQIGLEMASSPEINDFAVVILDGEINGHGGYELAESLRINGYKGIIVSVTGKPFTTAVPREKRWCFNVFYEKPADYKNLANRLLDEWLRE